LPYFRKFYYGALVNGQQSLLRMNFSRINKLSLLAYVVPVALITPSLIWIVLDKSVWTWDQAYYGRGSLELFFVLARAPVQWVARMVDVLHLQAPGISWFGQFFVPLGYLVGSVDAGLLLSIWATQALTLVLMYRSVWELSAHNQLVSMTGCLVVASAPLFVAMSHQYFAEPLQLLAVTWFVLIMSFAPRWTRAFTFSQLLVATPVAMLAKVSSPLYCVGPGLVALWYVFKPGPFPFVKHEWLQKRVVVTVGGGVSLSLAATTWYYKNITHVMQHLSESSSGPVAEIYGKRDIFLSTMTYWLGAVHESFFLPSVLLISGPIFGFGVICYFIRPQTVTRHFSMCGAIAIFQIIVVLAVFSLHSNRDTRYLLPLLPYLTLLFCWSLAQINRPILVSLTILIFSVQLASTYGQALGIVPPTTSSWLFSQNSDQKQATVLNSIVSRTCTKTHSQRYLTIIGIDLPWLNHESAAYFAAKSLASHNAVGCDYATVRSFSESPDKIWSWILSARIRYYVVITPDLHPVGADSHSQALNRNYLPMLKKVQSSGLFELEPPLSEDPSILIFRRNEIEPPTESR